MQFLPIKGNNFYKDSSDNFHPMETFVELKTAEPKILQNCSIYYSFQVISLFM